MDLLRRVLCPSLDRRIGIERFVGGYSRELGLAFDRIGLFMGLGPLTEPALDLKPGLNSPPRFTATDRAGFLNIGSDLFRCNPSLSLAREEFLWAFVPDFLNVA